MITPEPAARKPVPSAGLPPGQNGFSPPMTAHKGSAGDGALSARRLAPPRYLSAPRRGEPAASNPMGILADRPPCPGQRPTTRASEPCPGQARRPAMQQRKEASGQTPTQPIGHSAARSRAGSGPSGPRPGPRRQSSTWRGPARSRRAGRMVSTREDRRSKVGSARVENGGASASPGCNHSGTVVWNVAPSRPERGENARQALPLRASTMEQWSRS